MKTIVKSLLVAFSLSFITLSVSLAEINPTSRPKAVASYKTGIYSTREGKLNIALDKETGGSVDVRLTSTRGEVMFSQRIARNEKSFRIRLDMSSLPDGAYQVEITNGVETTIHNVTISTQQPSAPSRFVAIN